MLVTCKHKTRCNECTQAGARAPSAFSPWVFEVSISRLLFLTAIYSHLCLGTKQCAAALRTWRFVSAATTTSCQLNYTGCKHPLLHFHCGFKSFRAQTVGCNLILFSFCVNKFEDGVQIHFIDLVCTHKHKLALVSIFSLCVHAVEEVSKIRVKVHNNKW